MTRDQMILAILDREIPNKRGHPHALEIGEDRVRFAEQLEKLSDEQLEQRSRGL